MFAFKVLYGSIDILSIDQEKVRVDGRVNKMSNYNTTDQCLFPVSYQQSTLVSLNRNLVCSKWLLLLPCQQRSPNLKTKRTYLNSNHNLSLNLVLMEASDQKTLLCGPTQYSDILISYCSILNCTVDCRSASPAMNKQVQLTLIQHSIRIDYLFIYQSNIVCV